MAEKTAENNAIRAMSSNEYRYLKLRQHLLKNVIAQIWKDQEQADKLRAEYDDCGKQAEEILRSMNLTSADLLPKYVCNNCLDTGYAKDGTFCDCYPGDDFNF